MCVSLYLSLFMCVSLSLCLYPVIDIYILCLYVLYIYIYLCVRVWACERVRAIAFMPLLSVCLFEIIALVFHIKSE